MEITVRMQMPYDIDLISLFYNENFDLSEQIKKALIAWAREEKGFEISTPKYQHVEGLKLKWFHFHLDNEKYKDVIEKWNKIRRGYRNTFLKGLFRFYMTKPYIEVFQDRKENKVTKEIYVAELPYPVRQNTSAKAVSMEQMDKPERTNKATAIPADTKQTIKPKQVIKEDPVLESEVIAESEQNIRQAQVNEKEQVFEEEHIISFKEPETSDVENDATDGFFNEIEKIFA